MVFVDEDNDWWYLWDATNTVLWFDEGYGGGRLSGTTAKLWVRDKLREETISAVRNRCIRSVLRCGNCNKVSAHLDYLCEACRLVLCGSESS